MQQSNVIFAAIFLAFLIFITIKGELPAYLAIFFGSSGASGSASAGGASASADAIKPGTAPAAVPNPQSTSGLPTFQ